MKKGLLFLLVFFAATAAFAQQQIPKIGIINYSKLIQKVMPDQEIIQEVKAIKKAMADETASVEGEIANLEITKAEKLLEEKRRDVKKIDEQIESLRYYLKQFLDDKNRELDEKKAFMPDVTQSIENVLTEIQKVAESEGYSIIFDANDKNIIWWNQSVDITDLVMKKLR
mgnify:CR=1 FL=1